MSTQVPRLAGRFGGTHPAVRSRRSHEVLGSALIAFLPLVAGLAITVSYAHPNVLLCVGLVFGAGAIAFLLLNTRYEVTLTLLLLYLGLLDGPVKLLSSSTLTSGVRDVLILATVMGMLMRLVVSRQRVTLPPLSSWVLAFAAFVVIEAANPANANILKVVGGYRQELEWIPFFFFGFMFIRSKDRFRKLFLLIGVIALANGVAGAVQSRLPVSQVASWGPGYRELVYGGEEGSHTTGRTYAVEGVAHLRPPALGSDAGFGGAVGALALPMLLALLSTGGPPRRQALVLLLCAGAVLGIASSASRTSTVIAVVALLSFGGVSVLGGLRVSRALTALLAMLAVAFVASSLLVAYSGSSVFARLTSLTSVQKAEEHGGGGKTEELSDIPHYLLAAPFGFGLGTAGSASGFGGGAHVRLEGQRVSAGSAYGLLTKEMGAPGLLLWVGLTINALVLALTGLRRIADPELRTMLTGVVAAFIALTVSGLSGPTLAVTPGAFLWFACGIIAYWFGRGRLPERSETVLAS